MEIGYDTDVDTDLRDAVIKTVGELHPDDTTDLMDAVLLWWRDDDGDLVDGLLDARSNLDDDGTVWLLTPKANRAGHIDPATISEAGPLAGLKATKTIPIEPDWLGIRMRLGKNS
ncbi:DUF3052 domain-containing protein [Natronoglycomyces albus]|uniref:DUF3052 domain-containing protein n=2 Tax=Natronoglycomyces albus TaxID=2811108 RepID=A0A895XNV4_9ACTN|nr:DUF3052 domain-containing protein [Natronoglycomyces albus]